MGKLDFQRFLSFYHSQHRTDSASSITMHLEQAFTSEKVDSDLRETMAIEIGWKPLKKTF